MTIHHFVQGFAEQHSDAYLRKHVLPFLTHEGRAVDVKEFRYRVEQAKAQGYEVFPNPNCRNVKPSGHCGGCLIDERGKLIGPAREP